MVEIPNFCVHADPRSTREIPEHTSFLSRHGAQIGGLQIFLVSKIFVVRPCNYCGLSMQINTCKTPHRTRRSWTCLFLRIWLAKPKTPNLSPMADDTITQGGIRGLGSPLYICDADRTIGFLKICTLNVQCSSHTVYS